MIIYIVFTFLLVFAFAYYFAFEYFRYKTAKMMAEGLGGRAVFKLGRSYMSRDHNGVEEMAWIVPDDKMAWGSILTVLLPSSGKLFLRRNRDPGFSFDIEPKTGMLFRALSFDALKEAVFHVPQLDDILRLQTNNIAEAGRYFSVPEKQKALAALFHAGFTRLKGDGSIIATMHGISAEDINTERIGLFFKHLRSF